MLFVAVGLYLFYSSLLIFFFHSSEPPEELMCQLFPWLEAEQAALTARYRENTHYQDIALVSFFETLSWF